MIEELTYSDGSKLDAGKLRFDLLPWDAIEETTKVLMYGARKYAPGNWRAVEGGTWRYWNAALRHLVAHARGERIDAESGLPHLAHAACCVLFILSLDTAEHGATHFSVDELANVKCVLDRARAA